MAKDENLSFLHEHDKRFHPSGYHPGDRCKFRERLAEGDLADVVEASVSPEVEGVETNTIPPPPYGTPMKKLNSLIASGNDSHTLTAEPIPNGKRLLFAEDASLAMVKRYMQTAHQWLDDSMLIGKLDMDSYVNGNPLTVDVTRKNGYLEDGNPQLMKDDIIETLAIMGKWDRIDSLEISQDEDGTNEVSAKLLGDKTRAFTGLYGIITEGGWELASSPDLIGDKITFKIQKIKS